VNVSTRRGSPTTRPAVREEEGRPGPGTPLPSRSIAPSRNRMPGVSVRAAREFGGVTFGPVRSGRRAAASRERSTLADWRAARKRSTARAMTDPASGRGRRCRDGFPRWPCPRVLPASEGSADARRRAADRMSIVTVAFGTSFRGARQARAARYARRAERRRFEPPRRPGSGPGLEEAVDWWRA